MGHIGAGASPMASPQKLVKKPDFVRRDTVLSGDVQELQNLQNLIKLPQPMPPIKESADDQRAGASHARLRRQLLRLPPSACLRLRRRRACSSTCPRARPTSWPSIATSSPDWCASKLAADERFVSFGNQWMLAEKLTTLAKGELRQVRDFVEASGGPETDESLCTNVFNSRPGD